WLGCSVRDPKVPGSSRRQSGNSRTKNTQQQPSVPLLDGSTTNYINSIFSCIHQMAALQLLQHCSSPIQKSVTHFTTQKSMTHFIAQNLHVPAHQQSGQQSAHMHAAHRFLDIQIISKKLGIAPVALRVTPSYSDVYKPISTSGHWEFLLFSG
ncbi:hypothetical protein AVEN_197296-1, partial [Araneus ventricosus]